MKLTKREKDRQQNYMRTCRKQLQIENFYDTQRILQEIRQEEKIENMSTMGRLARVWKSSTDSVTFAEENLDGQFHYAAKMGLFPS